MKKYWLVIDGQEKGPFSLQELNDFGANAESYIWYDGLVDWAKFGETEDYHTYLNLDINQKKLETKEKSGVGRKILIFILLAIVSGAGYLVYDKYRFTEEMAREDATRLFDLLYMSDVNRAEILKLYPDYSRFEYDITLNGDVEIEGAYKDVDGNYEVVAYTETGERIYLLIEKEDGERKIIESRGLSYTYLNDVRKYGISKGCISGFENDALLEELASRHDLENRLLQEYREKLETFENNIKITSNLVENGGYYISSYLTGTATLINNNDIDLDMLSIDARLYYYDKNGGIIESSKVYFSGGANSFSTVSSSFLMSYVPKGARRYNVTFDLNPSIALQNSIYQKVLSSPSEGCE